MKKWIGTAASLTLLLGLASCGGGSEDSCVPGGDDCAEGFYCSQAEECIEDGTCLVHNDCDPSNSGEICGAGGECVAGTECGGGCAEGTFCSSELEDDICIPEGTCLGHDDCDENQNCTHANECEAQNSCSDNDDCADGLICGSNDKCIPEGSCLNSDDCGNSEYCLGEACVEREDCSLNPNACMGNSAEEGTLCSAAGYCIPPDECRTPDDCVVGECGMVGQPACETCVNRDCVTGGTCNSNLNCPEFFLCDFGEDEQAPGTCKFDFLCGNSGKPPLSNQTNLLIVLDRSGTMTGTLNGAADSEICGGDWKWDYAIDALTGFLGTLGDQSKIGMIPFPDPKFVAHGQGCQTSMEHPYLLDGVSMPRYVGEGNVSVFQQLLIDSCEDNDPLPDHFYNFPNGVGDNLYPDGPSVSPVVDAFEYAALDPFFQGEESGGNILYIGDGSINCTGGICQLVNNDTHTLGSCEQTGIIWDLANNHGVNTYILGFGDKKKIKEPHLNKMAVAGGTALPGETKYYLAEDGTELIQQLLAIGNQIRSCVYTFPADSEPLTDDTEEAMHVFIGTEEFFKDPVDGWTFQWTPDGAGPAGTGKVTFHGDSCDMLTEGGAEVSVYLGCPVPE